MNQRQRIVACARHFIDVRFIHQGRSINGLDCLGLLLATATHAGLVFEGVHTRAIAVPDYGLRPDVTLLKSKLDYFLVPISPAEILPADIVLLKVNGSPQHLAILSDYPMADEVAMVHAYAPARKVVEHRYDLAWRKATYAAYRLPQLV